MCIRDRNYTKPEGIKKLEDKVASIDKEKEEAVRVQDFEKAARLRAKAVSYTHLDVYKRQLIPILMQE